MTAFHDTPTNGRIVLVGGTGDLGLRIARALTARGAHVAALARSGTDTAALTGTGAVVRVVDFDDGRALRDAVTGAACVVSALNGLEGTIFDLQGSVFDAAVASRGVNTSPAMRRMRGVSGSSAAAVVYAATSSLVQWLIRAPPMDHQPRAAQHDRCLAGEKLREGAVQDRGGTDRGGVDPGHGAAAQIEVAVPARLHVGEIGIVGRNEAWHACPLRIGLEAWQTHTSTPEGASQAVRAKPSGRHPTSAFPPRRP